MCLYLKNKRKVGMDMKSIVKLMRPKHWIKNILIAIPAFFSKNLWETQTITSLILGFFCFSFASSAVYIFNDIKDIDKDRRHEVKCTRPLASGAVGISQAKALIVVLLAFAAAAGYSIRCARPYRHFAWCGAYLGINLAYSMKLKHVPVVDVCILAAGFLIRVFYGAAVSGSAVSSWLCLTVMSFALYMGIGKRRNELHQAGGSSTRQVLQYYDVGLLDKYMSMASTLGVVFYSLWAGSGTNVDSWAVWSVPLVLFILMKYEMAIRGNSYGDPVEVLLSDRALCGLSVFYAGMMCVLVYV